MDDYIKYVTDHLAKFQNRAELIRNNQLHPDDVNKALCEYLPMSYMLTAEYERVKREHLQIEAQYKAWSDKKFIEVKRELSESVSKSTKLAVSEIETEVRVRYDVEYDIWQKKLLDAESKVAFNRRLMEQWKSFDQILITISNNLRAEMRAITFQDRMNNTANQRPTNQRPIPPKS